MAYTDQELKFMEYWEKNRLKEKRLISQLTYGLPLGILFAVPVLINFLLGRFWYKRADAVGLSQFNPTILVVAVALIASFVGVMSRKFRWEKLENQYLSLKHRG